MSQPKMYMPRRTTAFMADGFKMFHSERQPDDINLIAEVERIYKEKGIHHKFQHLLDNDYTSDCIDRVPTVQRFSLNRYFTMVLMSSKQDSQEERYCLLDQGKFEDWLKLFEKKVIPFMMEHNLPEISNGDKTRS